jgi:hypothetical protein
VFITGLLNGQPALVARFYLGALFMQISVGAALAAKGGGGAHHG